MHKCKQIFILLLGLTFTEKLPLFSQYTMNSPYSRYGIGEMEFQGFTQNRSMGGWGISMRLPNQLNILNPAAATAQDSLSFIWDIGLKGLFSTYKTQSSQMRQRNFNFDHLAFSTALSKKISFGAGLVPYSKTGYNYYEINTLPDGEQIKTEYTGEGNINRFYITAAYALFNKKLSIGYQASFLFGSITHRSFTAMYNSTNNEYFGYYYPSLSDLSLSGMVHTFGLQGELPFSSKNKFIWGLTYEPSSHLSGDQSSILTRKYDTLSYHVDSGYLKIPSRIGAGIGLTLGDQLTMGIDYVMQDWSRATLFNRPDSFQQYYRVSFGAEYVYNKESYTSYLAKIRFRFGAHYENTYLRLNQQGINDYGISLGLAFPLRRTNTFLHVGFEIGKRGQTNHNLIEDNYKRFFISLSLYDFWFFKRKYD